MANLYARSLDRNSSAGSIDKFRQGALHHSTVLHLKFQQGQVWTYQSLILLQLIIIYFFKVPALLPLEIAADRRSGRGRRLLLLRLLRLRLEDTTDLVTASSSTITPFEQGCIIQRQKLRQFIEVSRSKVFD